MSENRNPHDAFIDKLRSEMPPSPDERAASRVHARVLAARPSRRVFGARSWSMAGGIAVATAVVACAVVLGAPRMETAAFAREQAVQALTFHVPGRVLHLEMTFMQEDLDGEAAGGRTNQRWSIWVDADGRRLREEFSDIEDGSLDRIHVRSGGHDIVLQPAYGDDARIVEYDATDQPIVSAVDDWATYMRDRIADGSAKVTGTKVIDGDTYWVVKWTDDDSGVTESVTLRTSDYLPRVWTREVTQKNGDTPGVVVKRATVRLVEYRDPASLPSDFFAIDAVKEIAAQKAASTQ